MTGPQILVNLVLAVLAYMFAAWVLGFVALPGAAVTLLAIIAALAVFFTNSAARLGVN